MLTDPSSCGCKCRPQLPLHLYIPLSVMWCYQCEITFLGNQKNALCIKQYATKKLINTGIFQFRVLVINMSKKHNVSLFCPPTDDLLHILVRVTECIYIITLAKTCLINKMSTLLSIHHSIIYQSITQYIFKSVYVHCFKNILSQCHHIFCTVTSPYFQIHFFL